MTYVISDIHGDFDRYQKMLEKINFDEERDVLFVLGDVIDYGKDSFRVLLDMSSRPNVYPILGEHEHLAIPLLKKLSGDISEKAIASFDAKTMQNFMEWGKMGGEETVRSFRELDEEDREWIIEYLEEFVPYEEVEVGGKYFVLAHAGIDGYTKSKELDEYDTEDFLTRSPDYSIPFSGADFLITGHTPTVEIHQGSKGRIFRLNNHIAIDCGAAYGMPLGCICLDTFDEFYID
nr:metallophosphoesterase [Clostridia bacterium]